MRSPFTPTPPPREKVKWVAVYAMLAMIVTFIAICIWAA